MLQRFFSFILVLFFLLDPAGTWADELKSGYMTVTDGSGRTIFETGHRVEIGDEFLDEDNQLYQIISLSGNSAQGRLIKKAALKNMSYLTAHVPSTVSVLKPYAIIYQTHTDESYIPTDGQSEQEGGGSIIKVGIALADALRNYGFEIGHSGALHDPHDANAYHRSRRTALAMMRKHYPSVIIDVHRDSVPLKNYHVVIDGEEAVKVLLVVGRHNQNREAIQNFAGNIKAVADNMHPGLIRGIFMAKGNYNQDLMPRSILLEMGTQYNTLEAAQRSASLIADTIPTALNLTNAGSSKFNFNALFPGFGDGQKETLWPSGGITTFFNWQNILLAFILLLAALAFWLYFLYGKFWERLKKWRP
ncbi:MAG: stage II sporulation protein P [Sporomusaceae bacterium]|jgi:stage II sporulation protein P|nr:stage II sporulation protein P [Sporomusaceae bacterium]